MLRFVSHAFGPEQGIRSHHALSRDDHHEAQDFGL
jgi:hypothetical protein